MARRGGEGYGRMGGRAGQKRASSMVGSRVEEAEETPDVDEAKDSDEAAVED